MTSETDPLLAPVPNRSRGVFRKTLAGIGHTLFTWDGLIGSDQVDYKTMFTPTLFNSHESKAPMFFGLNDKMPLLLGLILGLQHAMAMIGGLVSSALILASACNLGQDVTAYLVAVGLIGSGFLSVLQISRIRIFKTKWFIGTGLTSVLGVTFAIIPVFSNTVPVMYDSGFCSKTKDGVLLPCPDAYGAFIGTSCVCALFEVVMSFSPQQWLTKVFPPIVNGPVVLMIGAELVGSGMQAWAGGAGCMETGQLCPSPDAPKPYPWGSPQFILLGFSVFFTVVACDKWGPPFAKSCSIIVGLLVGCAIAGYKGYFDVGPINDSPDFQFIGDYSFNIRIYKPLILPILAVYMVCLMESIGDITATCDVSRVDTEGAMFQTRLQGGLLTSGICSMIGSRMHMMMVSSFAQNNGVIAMTQCASRFVGYMACMFLVLMGMSGKFTAAVSQIPPCVLGGMTTFLFCQVAVSGIRIISTIEFTRRDRVVLTVALMFGLASTLVDDWFERFFAYYGDKYDNMNEFMDAVKLVVGTGPAITGFAGLAANLFFPPVQDNYEPSTPTLSDENDDAMEDEGSPDRRRSRSSSRPRK